MMANSKSIIALEADADDPDDFAVSAAGIETALEERRARRGRPSGWAPPERKMPVTLRLDPGVVERFKADGPGWQTRMNEALRKAAGL